MSTFNSVSEAKQWVKDKTDPFIDAEHAPFIHDSNWRLSNTSTSTSRDCRSMCNLKLWIPLRELQMSWGQPWQLLAMLPLARARKC